MATARDAYTSVRHALDTGGAAEPDAKARLIVAHALCISPSDVFLELDVPEPVQVRISAMAQRCMQGEPVEYVTGKAFFRYLELTVTPDVLIPRHETELVAQAAIERIKAFGYQTALDIGTGSGCIAISLATEAKVRVEACDISSAALALAEKNAHSNGAQVRFFLSDMLTDVSETYDIIVSNPPYISEDEYQTLDRGVKEFEPALALKAGDGLNYYRVLASGAGRYLNPNGALVLEIGCGQAADVTALLRNGGFDGIQVKKDYSGRDRIVTARKV